MKTVFKSILLSTLYSSLLLTSVAQASWTGLHVVGRIQLTTGGTVYVRPLGYGPWGGDDCPNAIFAYVGQSSPVFDDVMALFMTSKLNSTPIQMRGTCNSTGTYILVDYIVMEEG